MMARTIAGYSNSSVPYPYLEEMYPICSLGHCECFLFLLQQQQKGKPNDRGNKERKKEIKGH